MTSAGLHSQVLRGKKILLVVIASVLCWVGVVLVVETIWRGPNGVLQNGASRLFICGLLILGYDGHLWAKRIAEVILIISAFVEVAVLVFGGHLDLFFRGMLVADALVAGAAGAILLSSFSITAYTSAQRKSRLGRRGLRRWL
jgi:hypothetical protein